MTEPWDLPEGWVWATFQEVAQIASDLVSPADHQDEPHIAPNHIESGSGHLLPYTTIAADKVTSPKHRFRPGQILYSKIRPYLCKAVRVDFGGLCSADMYPITAKIDAGYLHRWMLSLTFTEWASGAQGRTVLPKINQEALSVIQVPVPPLAEQRRIVAKIEELTARSRAARAALTEVPTLLEQFRHSVLASAFRGDLTAAWREKHPDSEPASVLLERIRDERRKQWEAKYPKKTYVEPDSVDETELPELPDGWCWAAFGELVTNHDSKRVPVKDADRRSRQGEYPYYGAFGIIDSVDSYLFEGSYLLVAEDGKNLLTRNKPIAFLAHGKFWVNNHAHVVQPRGGIPLEYLEGYLNAFDLAQYVTGIDQVKLNREAMDRIPVALAPEHEQHVLVSLILDRLSVANRARESVDAAINEFDNLDQSILAKAFRGELVPQDPADEPAATLLARIRTGGGATPPTTPTRSAKRGQVKFYILLLLRTWNKPLGREMLERGLVLMLNADVRRAILGRSKPMAKRTKNRGTPPQFVSGMDALLGEMIDDGQLVPGPEAGFFAEGQHGIDFTTAPPSDLDAVRETAEVMKVIHKDRQQATDADIVSALNGEIYELVS